MEDRNEVERSLRFHIENLERRMESMMEHHQNEQYASTQCINALVSQVVETNRQLIAFTKQQGDEIATLRLLLMEQETAPDTD